MQDTTLHPRFANFPRRLRGADDDHAYYFSHNQVRTLLWLTSKSDPRSSAQLCYAYVQNHRSLHTRSPRVARRLRQPIDDDDDDGALINSHNHQVRSQLINSQQVLRLSSSLQQRTLCDDYKHNCCALYPGSARPSGRLRGKRDGDDYVSHEPHVFCGVEHHDCRAMHPGPSNLAWRM